MYETRGDLSFSYDYDSYGHLSCIHYMWANGSSWKFYVACNSRGDVTAIYAADGTLRAKYTYDSWGNTLSIIDRYGNNIAALGDEAIAADNIGALNRIRYRGYYYDNESGLYYLQSRYYDPQVKRFLNADGYIFTGQGVLGSNMFGYCGNNPISRIDDGGEAWWIAASALVGGLVSGTFKVVTNIACGKKWNDELIGAVTGGAVYGGVLASTGNILTASFTSAVAESVTNEVFSYVPTIAQANGKSSVKAVTPENINKSMESVALNTLKNGLTYYIAGTIAAETVPISSSLPSPQTFVSSFTGQYAIASHSQTVAQALFIAGMEVSVYFVNWLFESYREFVESVSELERKENAK